MYMCIYLYVCMCMQMLVYECEYVHVYYVHLHTIYDFLLPNCRMPVFLQTLSTNAADVVLLDSLGLGHRCWR